MWETAVHMAVAGGFFDGVFCAVLFPTRCLNEIWDLTESVSEGFLTYSVRMIIQTKSNTSICEKNQFYG